METLKYAALQLLTTSLIILTVGSRSITAANPNALVHVNIWNRMPQQGTDLTSRCKSMSDDKGIIGAGTDVAISFDVKPDAAAGGGDKLFYCVLQSKYGFLVVNVYDLDRDSGGRCKSQCDWNVREDGVHGVNQITRREDLFIKWGPALPRPGSSLNLL